MPIISNTNMMILLSKYVGFSYQRIINIRNLLIICMLNECTCEVFRGICG